MPVHDRFARLTPFELFLPEEGYAQERFDLIRQEAQERGGDLDDPEAFPLLAAAGAVLRDIRPEEEAPGSIGKYADFLFHAFHFWQEGCPLYLVETPVARFLVETGPSPGSWVPSLPERAGYIQLPQHLFWTTWGGEGTPESLDGFFWTRAKGNNLGLLVVLGMRRDRPGLAVVPLPLLPLEAAAAWASVQVREEGGDFRTALPGAELEGLYGVEVGAEAVKLALRIFWYLEVFPAPVAEGRREVGEEEGGVRASRLPYRRVVLRAP